MPITNLSARHHAASGALRARHSANRNNSIRDRVISVVAQDRLEFESGYRQVEPDEAEAVNNENNRGQFLRIAKREWQVISDALIVCKKIATQLEGEQPVATIRK